MYNTIIKIKKGVTKLILFILVTLLFYKSNIYGQSMENTDETHKNKHSIDISPISPFVKIYAIQYSYLFLKKNQIMLGFAYVNVKYVEGRSHAPTLIVGYRRFIWKDLHLEYQLWPAYNNYYEINEKKYYSGFELWNEFRVGYQIDFKIGNMPFFVNPQILGGFGLFPGNKPDSFIKNMKAEPVFIYPNIFVGLSF